MTRTHAPLALLLGCLAAGKLAAQAPTIDAQPVATIAATRADGSVRFEQVVDADFIPGGIVVTDALAGTLVFLDLQGMERHRAGGVGEGPAEFRRLNGAVVCGGRLFAYELTGRRLTEFAPDGRHVADHPFPPRATTMVPPACTPTGALAILAGMRPSAEELAPNIRSATGTVMILAPGETTGPTVEFASIGQLALFGGGGSFRPLGPVLSLAGVTGGVLAGTGADSSVRLVATDGSATDHFLPLAARRVRPEDVEAAIELTAGRVPAQLADRVRTSLRALEMPETLPYHGAMLPAPDGLAWLDRSAPGDPRQRWVVTDGRQLLGEVRVPVPGRLMAIGDGMVAVLVTSSDGEQAVALHRTRK